MRQVITVVLVLALTTVIVPPAGAASGCSDQSDVSQDGTYVRVNDRGDVEIWQESNDQPGLQTSSCEDEDGNTVPPDSHEATVPPDVPIPDLSGIIQAVEDLCSNITPQGIRCAIV